jgi:hypothetical protein
MLHWDLIGGFSISMEMGGRVFYLQSKSSVALTISHMVESFFLYENA